MLEEKNSTPLKLFPFETLNLIIATLISEEVSPNFLELFIGILDKVSPELEVQIKSKNIFWEYKFKKHFLRAYPNYHRMNSYRRKKIIDWNKEFNSETESCYQKIPLLLKNVFSCLIENNENEFENAFDEIAIAVKEGKIKNWTAIRKDGYSLFSLANAVNNQPALDYMYKKIKEKDILRRSKPLMYWAVVCRKKN
jgi:hypothetical protein